MKVYSSPNLAMVGHFKNVLEMHGIACDIRGEHRGAALGGLPPTLAWPELWVLDESQAEEAMQVVEEAMGPVEQEVEDWKCPGCGEVLEGQFELCWNCGAGRPGA